VRRVARREISGTRFAKTDPTISSLKDRSRQASMSTIPQEWKSLQADLESNHGIHDQGTVVVTKVSEFPFQRSHYIFSNYVMLLFSHIV